MNDLSTKFLEVMREMCQRDIGGGCPLPETDYHIRCIQVETDDPEPIGWGPMGPINMPVVRYTIEVLPVFRAFEPEPPRPKRPDYTHESTADEIRELPESRRLLNRGGSES